jgi:4a-hydroxytetrahydrobiopterin dehydratase
MPIALCLMPFYMNHTIEETPELLTLSFQTHSYADSVKLSNKAFALGDKLNHHAVVTTCYNKVVIELTTHDSGNKVTKKDHEFLQLMLE